MTMRYMNHETYLTEIQETRSRLDQLEAHASFYLNYQTECDRVSLELEQKLVNRLRDAHKRIEELEYALRSIVEVPIGAEIPDRTTIWGLATYMHETAKDALKEGKDEQ
jgi:hypothetical protein